MIDQRSGVALEIQSLQDFVALIENNHEGSPVRRQGKCFLSFAHFEGIGFAVGRCRNFNVHRHVEQAYHAFDFLCLLHGQFDLVVCVVVRVTHVVNRRPRAINPLLEELVHVRRSGLLNGFLQVRGNHVLPAIRFQVIMQPAEKILIAELGAQHLQDPAALGVDVAGVFERVVKIMGHDRIREEPGIAEPLALVAPEFISYCIFAVLLLSPKMLKICGEAFIQPETCPILAGDQISKPLMRHFVRIEVVRA